MLSYLKLPLLGIFLLIIFTGCTSTNQPLACFKGSPSCYTQQNVHTDEAVCSNCVAIL